MTEEIKKTESTESEREIVTDAEGKVVSDGAKERHDTTENKEQSRSVETKDGGSGADKPA